RIPAMVSMISPGRGSMDTTIAFSSGVGSSSTSNWLSNRLAGMKCLAAGNERAGALKVDEPNVPPLANNGGAVAPLQSGAGDDGVAAIPPLPVDPFGNGLQPRPPVLVGQRYA